MKKYLFQYYLGVECGANFQDISTEIYDTYNESKVRLDEVYEGIIQHASEPNGERYDAMCEQHCIKNDCEFSVDTGIFYEGKITEININ